MESLLEYGMNIFGNSSKIHNLFQYFDQAKTSVADSLKYSPCRRNPFDFPQLREWWCSGIFMSEPG